MKVKLDAVGYNSNIDIFYDSIVKNDCDMITVTTDSYYKDDLIDYSEDEILEIVKQNIQNKQVSYGLKLDMDNVEDVLLTVKIWCQRN